MTTQNTALPIIRSTDNIDIRVNEFFTTVKNGFFTIIYQQTSCS